MIRWSQVAGSLGSSASRSRPRSTAPRMMRTPTPRTTRSSIIWPVTTSRAVSAWALMSPNPTVEKIVTVKYSASVRDKAEVKVEGHKRLIKK